MRTKVLLLALLTAGSLQAARPLSVGPLPESFYADTEVSTNVAFALDYARLATLHLTLECEASATNSLEVKVGCDTDADGNLSIEESDLMFGYDCGEWFVRDVGAGSRPPLYEMAHVHSSTPTHNSNSPVRRDLAIAWRNVAPTWNLLKVTRRGPPSESSTAILSVENKHFMLFLR